MFQTEHFHVQKEPIVVSNSSLRSWNGLIEHRLLLLWQTVLCIPFLVRKWTAGHKAIDPLWVSWDFCSSCSQTTEHHILYPRPCCTAVAANGSCVMWYLKCMRGPWFFSNSRPAEQIHSPDAPFVLASAVCSVTTLFANSHSGVLGSTFSAPWFVN